MSDLFNEKAKDWDADEMKRLLSSAVGSSILKHVPLHQQMDVMDFGAGTGLISSHVVPLVNKIVAVDISKAMLDKLISKPELQGKVEAVCQDRVLPKNPPHRPYLHRPDPGTKSSPNHTHSSPMNHHL